MKLYKLTDQMHQTKNCTQWGEEVTHATSGTGSLCGPGWLHAYLSPELAVLLNPIHADIAGPVLWECEGEVDKNDHDLKVGCTRLTTLHTIPLPAVTVEQRVAFAIYCAKAVYSDLAFVKWADRWLDGSDRSERAAEAAEVEAAMWAAKAATRAEAKAAMWAAKAAAGMWVAKAAAARAAEAAVWAAAKPIDLVALAKLALSTSHP